MAPLGSASSHHHTSPHADARHQLPHFHSVIYLPCPAACAPDAAMAVGTPPPIARSARHSSGTGFFRKQVAPNLRHACRLASSGKAVSAMTVACGEKDAGRCHHLKPAIATAAQTNVRDDEVEGTGGEHRLGALQRCRRNHHRSVNVKKLDEGIVDADFVLDYEDARFGCLDHVPLRWR